jgi:hypothetical protein
MGNSNYVNSKNWILEKTIGSFVLTAVCWAGTVAASAQESYLAPPPELTLPAGSWISIRVNEPLSSDRNRPGDYFIGSLAQPVVANGFVIAHRGQTVEGRIVVAEKAGRRTGTSSLGIELAEISLVDGRQMPVATEWVEHVGPTSRGDDAVAIAATTGIGAAIGAAADGGFGAGMGAIAGAAASTIGVLATRGKPTEVYPESMLTFRTLSPITIDTAAAEAAYQPVRPEDYEQVELRDRPGRIVPAHNPYKHRPRVYGGYYGYPYLYDPYPYPYVYGPTVVIRPAPRYYYRPRAYRSYGPTIISPRIVIGGGRDRGNRYRGDRDRGGRVGGGRDFRGGNSGRDSSGGRGRGGSRGRGR